MYQGAQLRSALELL